MKIMASQFTETGKAYNFGFISIHEIVIEPCYRLTQWGKGLPITCECAVCKAKNQTPEQAKDAVDKAHGVCL